MAALTAPVIVTSTQTQLIETAGAAGQVTDTATLVDPVTAGVEKPPTSGQVLTVNLTITSSSGLGLRSGQRLSLSIG